VGETSDLDKQSREPEDLSVSSNGSTWVKPSTRPHTTPARLLSVSSNGSTWVKLWYVFLVASFRNILSVSSNGSTWVKRFALAAAGELKILSVSSNGSTWVKLLLLPGRASAFSFFQYPRTDRRG